AGVWVAFARGTMTRDRLLLASAASVAAFVAFSKVFSPQFMIWLIPLVALAPSVTAWGLLVAGLVLTQLWFPDRYWLLALQLRGCGSGRCAPGVWGGSAFSSVGGRGWNGDGRPGERRPGLDRVEPVRSQVQV